MVLFVVLVVLTTWSSSEKFFLNPNHLKTWLPIHWCPSLLHSKGWMPCKQHPDNPTVYQTHVFAKLQKQLEDWLHLENYWTAIESKRLNYNDSSIQVLGVFGNLSIGKIRRCINESELCSWKSCSG
jgi:hypothetical protein